MRSRTTSPPNRAYQGTWLHEIGNGDITNFNGRSYGEITLARATEVSANTVYAQLGMEMGAEMLVKTAEDFGFDQDIKFDLPLAKSLMPKPEEMTEWETAWAAAGRAGWRT